MKKYIIITIFLFFLSAGTASAATRTWVGGTSSAWNTATNWAENAVPTSADDVVMNASPTSLTINLITTAGSVKSINFTGAGANLITFSGNVNLTSAGNVTLQSGMSWTMTGLMVISGNSTFTSNSVVLTSGIVLNTASVTLTLGDALNVGNNGLNISKGTLDTGAGNNSITCANFNDNGSASARTLTLHSSVITVTSLIFSGAGALTITSAAHTININSDTGTANNFLGNSGWGTVNLNLVPTAARAYAITFGTGAAFAAFNIAMVTNRQDATVSLSGDFSVANSSSFTGGSSPIYRPLIISSVLGTQRTMTVTAASKTITLTDVDLRDFAISTTNSPTVTGTRVGDTGRNTNAGVSTPKTVYANTLTAARNTTDNIWSNAADRSTYSLASFYPLPQDTMVIDNTSGDNTNKTLTINSGRNGSLDTSALTESVSLQLTGSQTFYGSFFKNAFLGIIGGSGTYIFDSSIVSPLTINTFNSTSHPVTVNSYSGTVKLAGAITTSATFTLTQGTLDLNGQIFTLNIFSSSNTNTRVLQDTAGGGKIVCKNSGGTTFDMSTDTNLTVSNSPAIDIGTSALTLTADVTVAFGSTVAKTFGDIKFTKHAGNFQYIVTGTGNTFGTFTLETPDGTFPYSNIEFTAGTQTNVGSFVAVGTASQQITIQSVTAATHTLSDTGGTNTVQYTTITNSIATGGATWNALTSAGNVDGGGNTGWIFTVVVAPTVTTSSPSPISNTSAKLNGNITATGGANATQNGFAYGTTNDLSIVIATTTLGGQSGTGSFSQSIGSLTPNTLYYFRAYATNSAGTGYGTIQSSVPTAISTINVPTNFLALNSGLVGWWTFDGKNTDWNKYLTYDLSGKFATGTINKILATSTAAVQGKDGQALLFKYGVSLYRVDISLATSSIATGDLTFAAWLKPSSTQTNSVIMHLGDSLSTNDVILQYGNEGFGCGTGLNFFTYTGSVVKCANAAGFSTITVGAWYHLVGTFSATNGMVVYVNGVNTGTNTNTVRGSTKSNTFGIGADPSGVGNTRSFDGAIDDVRVYNRALSAAEVLQLYDATAGGRANTSLVGPGNLNSSLVGWWTFDGKNTDWSKNQTYDSSGQANTGTLLNMSTTSSPVAGKIGQALKITNTSQYISMGQVNVTHTGTVSVWYKYTLFTANDVIMSNANFSSDRNGFVLAQGSAGIWFELDSATAKETFQTASKYNDNKWHLFTVAWDGNYVSFYVDGALAPMYLSAANPIAQTLDVVSNVYNLKIAQDGAGSYHLHDGSIDDVRVYNRALTASEVKQLYNMGIGGRL